MGKKITFRYLFIFAIRFDSLIVRLIITYVKYAGSLNLYCIPKRGDRVNLRKRQIRFRRRSINPQRDPKFVWRHSGRLAFGSRSLRGPGDKSIILGCAIVDEQWAIGR